jgi:hypothetical protein
MNSILGMIQTKRTKLIQFFRMHTDKLFIYSVLVLLVIISFAHLFRLDSIPTGLYLDETSIGYNAALITKTGVDEHGVHFPLFFKAFGEYKNPLYIYAAALLFKFFGVSEFNLRFTSFLFYISALIFSTLLVFKIFKKNRIILIYYLLSFGFLPHFFTISRISFEVISQLTFISAVLLLVYLIFEDQNSNSAVNFKVLVCGLVLGLSVYTYSTARLLSFLLLVSIWVFYFNRKNLKKLTSLTLMFLTSLIPYVVFAINNPEALTSRFNNISYISSSLPLIKKVSTFLSNTITYWSPDYLIKNGDANLRHSIGYGGVIFTVTFFMFLLGMASILTNKKLVFNRFNLFLISNLLFSPLAAILTSDGTPHALRSLLLGYYILIISCYGFRFICELTPNYHRQIFIAGVLVYLLFEIIGYQANYFIVYPAKSIAVMNSYDLKKSLQNAINQNPTEVLFPDKPKDYYASINFFSLLVRNPQNIPILMSTSFTPIPGSCVLYHRDVEYELDHFPNPYYELENHYVISLVEKAFKVEPPASPIKARCYKVSK